MLGFLQFDKGLKRRRFGGGRMAGMERSAEAPLAENVACPGENRPDHDGRRDHDYARHPPVKIARRRRGQ